MLFDSALAQVGMTASEVHFNRDEMATYGGARWQLSYFTLFNHDPFRLPLHGLLLREGLASGPGGPTELLTRACRLVDHPIRRGLIGDPLEPYLIFPDTAPRPSFTHSRNLLPGPEYASVRDRVDLIYAMADDSKFLFNRALKPADKNKVRERLFSYFTSEDEQHIDLVYEVASQIDMDRMLAGAQDLAEAARRMTDSTAGLVFPEVRREVKTDRGLVVIGSTGNDKYEYFVPPLLIFDGSGDDEYVFGGYPDGCPITMVVDLSGNDRYLSRDSTLPGIGGVVLGMSVLIDRAGDDVYEAVNVAQGAAIFGVGILYDAAGIDRYSGRALVQGAAAFGVGILADSLGFDSVYCVAEGQGFGYTKGCGLLVDWSGDDVYVAEDDSVINPASQTGDHNSSLAQGVGFGKRADYLDGHSWAGGVGILCDLAGNDRYSAGLFAQGCAYWRAVGMLLDGSGDDVYSGVWYVQGSGAHFAVGYLDDFDGNDTYTATHNMAVGAGHDFTIGYLNERAGNDTYTVPNLSLGGGNANGIGIFHDHEGDDTYVTKGGITLGRAASDARGLRGYLHTMGIFIDGGGVDNYVEPYASNGTRWLSPPADTSRTGEYEIGVGLDR